MLHSALADDLEVALASHDGLVTTAQLTELGFSSRAVSRAVATGRLAPLRRGVYADAAVHAAADPEERHVWRMRAEAAVAHKPLVFSHASAAALHGLPFIGDAPGRVHVVAETRSGSNSAGRCVHTTQSPVRPVVVEGLLVTSLERTVVDLALTASFAAALAAADRALALIDADTPAPLLETLESLQPTRGLRRALRVLRAADRRSGSAGESLSRARMIELGFEVPELQVRFDRPGGGVSFVDFFWRRQALIGEFDGLVKYSRSRELNGMSPAASVIAEKRREDELRRQVRGFERWTWDDAISPRRFGALLSDFGVPRA
ncbi:type IV toxin-antitoxin system AbiEi family antitoxin domain-containing protein [Ruicaihuangia caeni]|uniref:Type IV toxin-antitoxin system AbiEi family antitoxin domain-containing protein n=1 Tax=Ruicaihuangia caeni TaxID=3042517 RepID=A0AAW6TCQ7_9MICO|nr:type IV toxin-antitoxin system AbiEi family antitoxin domain-containing protein [Klugiella sp. YN-L-19]MDI2098837.1 type IV toxin-antitoxin system AbiEi family antitoxin domain-containing protein [Klugiella sp. YN-L-19]